MNSTHPPNPPASQNDIKALDTIRRSLLTLTNSLTSLQHTLAAPPTANAPLPSWSSLQTNFTLLTHNLLALSEHLDSSRDLLTRAHAYPLPSFPGVQQEALLSQLLKKKADVDVERWMRRAEETGDRVSGAGRGNIDGETTRPLPRGDDMVALWEWAGNAALEAAEAIPWGIDVTIEERERDGGVEAVKAKSGLKRELKSKPDGEQESDREGEDDEGDEEDDELDDDAGDGGEMEVDSMSAEVKAKNEAASTPSIAPMIPIEDVLKFMITGAGAEPEGRIMSGALR